ncbi:B3 domain-containing transcription factor VRN1-like isoform X2 [Carica papaya]|uniref:B3 domain-containing transcription factor VRN1-like isoform X2 n=1 Tax=Carica papaya TaxID=3649 RepID=UPI000B8D0E3A|nr:B3 domain-containing transcription factor VRN1-like isoform X2 [Carica papaya]
MVGAATMAVSGRKQGGFSQLKFTAETPHFFKIILQDSLRDGKFKIPEKFWQKFGSGISSSVKLVTPCGAVWRVGVTKNDLEGWLQHGWREFSEHYSLSRGDLVVFRYDGDGIFYITIFDMTATEIDYPFVGSNGEVFGPREEGTKERPCRKRRDKSPLPCPKPFKSIKTYPASEKVGGKNCDDSLAADEKSKAIQKAIAFKSNNPFFLIVMQPSYINSALTIPVWFVKKYLTEKHGEMILQILDGTSWTVGYDVAVWNRRTHGRFYCKWKAFAEDNNLEVGDVCVFELIKRAQLMFKVIIYRNNGSPNCYQTQGMSSTTRKCLNSEECPTVQPTTWNKIACQRPLVFNSKNPFFVVVMKPCHVNPKKTNSQIPKGFAERHLKEGKGEVHLQTQDGRSWDLQYNVHVSGGRLRAHFDSRWRTFVQGNNLKAGDTCFFELIPGPKTMFNVVIKRAKKDANHGLTTRYEGECRKLKMETGVETTQKHSSQATASGREFGSK